MDADMALMTPKRSDSSTLKKEAADLSEIEEVLFVCLYWRVLDSQAPNPILGCPYAQDSWDRCVVNKDKSWFARAHDQRWVRCLVNRTRTMDKWCQQFLDVHAGEELQVLHLCCGLDARAQRLKWGSNVRWIDIDLPNVVNLRNRVMSKPEGDYSLRSLSVATDGWFRDIPSDRRTIIICESCFMYFEETKMKTMLRDLVEYFKNGQLIFDTSGSLPKKYNTVFKKTNVRIRWTVDDAREVEKYHPKLKLIGRVRWQEYLGSELPLGQNLPPIFGPWTTALLALRSSPAFKDIIQVLRFHFGDRAESVNSSEFTLVSEHEDAGSTAEAPQLPDLPKLTDEPE